MEIGVDGEDMEHIADMADMEIGVAMEDGEDLGEEAGVEAGVAMEDGVVKVVVGQVVEVLDHQSTILKAHNIQINIIKRQKDINH